MADNVTKDEMRVWNIKEENENEAKKTKEEIESEGNRKRERDFKRTIIVKWRNKPMR